MTRYIQGKDGKFAGSIGDGKSSIPTPSDLPATQPSDMEQNTASVTTDDLYARFKSTVTEAVELQHAAESVTTAAQNQFNELYKLAYANKDVVIEQTTDDQGNTRTVYANGRIVYRDPEGNWHREDGPAIISENVLTADGIYTVRLENGEQWYKHGKPHRLDGPAATGDSVSHWKDGRTTQYLTTMYAVDGLDHRVDGPAVFQKIIATETDGSTSTITLEEWKQHGEYERDPADGPAMIRSSDDGREPVVVYVHNGIETDANGNPKPTYPETGNGPTLTQLSEPTITLTEIGDTDKKPGFLKRLFG